jgi:ferredoxin
MLRRESPRFSQLQPLPNTLMPLSSRPPLVRVEPLGCTFEAPAGLNVLEAASFADVQLPRSCRNGTCRTCLCRLLSGTVSYQIEWPGLSKEEKTEGLILPCVAVAESDLVIEVQDA